MFKVKSDAESGNYGFSFTGSGNVISGAATANTAGTAYGSIDYATPSATLSISGVAPTLNKVTLANSSVTVAGGDNEATTVQATAASAKGTNITDKVAWSVSPEAQGVTINALTGLITVAAKAKAGAYTITATADGPNVLTTGLTKTATLTVERAAAAAASGTVTGADSIEIPASDSKTESYTAAFFDQYDTAIAPTVTWSIEPSKTGVSIDNTGVVTVTSEAKTPITTTTGTTFTVKATSDNSTVATKTVTVKRAASAAASIVISGGSATIAVPTVTAYNGSNTATGAAYTAAVNDQYGTAITNPTVTWSIANAPTGVSINASTGVVSVTNKAAATIESTPITVTATCGNATKTTTFAITKAPSAVTFVTVCKGDTAITADTIVRPVSGSDKTVTYTAKTYDQFGDGMTGEQTYTWTNTGTPPTNVTFANGLVTVPTTASTGKFTITAKNGNQSSSPVTVTVTNLNAGWSGITAKNGTYGDTNASLISGLPTDNTATLKYNTDGTTTYGSTLTGTYAVTDGATVQNAGSNKTITVTFTASNDSSNGDYKNVVLSKDYTVTIAKKAITATVTPKSIEYNADIPAFDFTLLDGALVGNDTKEVLGLTLTTTAAKGSAPGTYDVTKSTQSTANYDVTVSGTNALTITKAAITSVTDPTAWTTILANDAKNADAAALLTAVGTDRTTLTATYAGGTTSVTATWKLTNGTWNAKGGTYTYTATLAPTDTTNIAATTITKTLSVTVTAVTGTVMWTPATLTKAKAEITAASNLAGIGLPASINVSYDNSVAAGTYTIEDANYDTTLATLKGYDVSTADKTVTIKMTGNIFPAWATIDTSSFKTDLTITAKYPVTVAVTAPADIAYGATLGDPTASQTAIDHETDTNGTYTYLYTGTTAAGKAYSSAEKPTEAGTYTVTATLNSDTHSGHGTSAQFTIAKKNVTVTFTNPSNLTYDNTAKTVTAAVIGKVGEDDLSAAITYTQTAPTATAPTNAGTYTVTATLTGTKAANYNLTGTTTETLTIAKAARVLTGVPTSTTLTVGKLTDTIKPSVSDLDKSAKYTYSSDRSDLVTVDNAGKVTAVANGSATITVTVPATTNYETATATCIVKSVPQPITSVTVLSSGDGDKLTCELKDKTIKVAGVVTSGKTITVTPACAGGLAALSAGAITTVTATDNAALTTGGSFTVKIGGDEKNTLTYTIDTSHVAIKDENVNVAVPTVSPTVDPAVTDKTAKDALNTTLGLTDLQSDKPKAEGLEESTAKGLIEATKAVTEKDNDKIEEEIGSGYTTEIKTTVEFKGTSYDNTNKSIGLVIEPKYSVTAKKGEKTREIVPSTDIPESCFSTGVTLSVHLPKDFPKTNLYAKHQKQDGSIEYIKITVVDNVATWTQYSFSPTEIVSYAGYAQFKPDTGAGSKVQYTYADIDQTLPTDSKTGSTFNGWKVDSGTTVYTKVTEDFLKAINGKIEEDPALLTPDFTVVSTPSYGGGGGGVTTYTVTVGTVTNGKVTASTASAEAGKTVTLTVAPATGYALDTLTVTDASKKTVATTKASDTSYTFTMPAANVTVAATFKQAETKKDVSDIFPDVPKTGWQHDAIQYVYDNSIMKGTDKGFAPDDTMSRAMIVTTIYRLAGSPAVTGTSSFTDVKAGQWYTDAVLWASQNKITNGYTDGRFGINDPVTREQLVVFFYNYAKLKGIDVSVGENTNILSYNDAQSISEYAIPAMQWACGAGLVEGDGQNLTPKATATRAQNAAILMRFQTKIAK